MSEQNRAPREPEQEQSREDVKPQGERRGGGRHNATGRRRFQNQSPPRHSESTLNINELREVMELFSAHGLTDFELENKDIRVRLSRNQAANPLASAPAGGRAPESHSSATPAPTAPPPPVSESDAATVTGAPPPVAAPGASPAAAGAAAENKTEANDEKLFVITSPIVGTFYRAPSPNADPFVRAGSKVESDTVVCIIEAMKLMNEILAETSGVVEKIFVENAQPVEYGQPLFGIKK